MHFQNNEEKLSEDEDYITMELINTYFEVQKNQKLNRQSQTEHGHNSSKQNIDKTRVYIMLPSMKNFTLGNDVAVELRARIKSQSHRLPPESGDEVLQEMNFEKIVEEND